MKEINKRIRKGEKWQDIVGEYEICEKDTAQAPLEEL